LIVAYIVYDAAVFYGLAVLNPCGSRGAHDAPADAGEDGWRGAATASSAALGALFLLLIAVVAALAIAGSGNHMLTSGPNDIVGRLRVDFVPARDAYHGRSV
jgi:hypothetical protein